MPTGPIPARFLFLGEGPSTAEDKQGCPFVGKTGSELRNVYMPIASIYPGDCYIDNAARCSKQDYDNPTNLEAQGCCNFFLGPILHQVQPQIVIAMGGVACSVFAEVKDLTMQHGVPISASYTGHEFVLFPTYHPSAGIHSPGFMIPLMSDFRRLGELIKELDRL